MCISLSGSLTETLTWSGCKLSIKWDRKKKRLGLVFLLNLLIPLIVYQTVMSPKTRWPCCSVTAGSMCVWTHQVCFPSNDLNLANAPVNKCWCLWRLLLLLPPCRAPSTSAVFVCPSWPLETWSHSPQTSSVCILRPIWLGQYWSVPGGFWPLFCMIPWNSLLTNWIANFATEKCHLANSERTALAIEKLHMSVSILIKFCIKDSRKDSFQLISSFGKISIYCLVPSSYHFNFHFLWF